MSAAPSRPTPSWPRARAPPPRRRPVLRPALRSVTRRTLTSVFARERSINFCRLRTLFRSPACDAVKIRCRNRRTFPSAARQSTARQTRIAFFGPFATTIVVASNLPIGSGVAVIFFFTGSPGHLGALSGRATRARIRPVIPDDRRRSQPSCPGFLLSFDCRRSLLGHRAPAGELGLPCGRLPGFCARTPTGSSRSPRASAAGVGAPYTPGLRCSPDRLGVLRSAPPLPSGQSWTPLPQPICGGSDDEASTGVYLRSPVRPSSSPVAPGWNGSPWACNLSFAPRRHKPTTHVRAGTGPEHWPVAAPSTSTANRPPMVSSLTRATSRRSPPSDYYADSATPTPISGHRALPGRHQQPGAHGALPRSP